ncbi:MAG: PD-(D/E)XK nuclease family protein [Actinobacteria bacterium]|nr:PD-(D/E)XK nuclease family protein [Actinomycetota bacterium]
MTVTADPYNQNVPVEGTATAYGKAAVTLLARQVVEIKGGDPLAPVTVVVASNYVAVAARRALAARPGGVVNVSFLTLHRLAERLGAPTLAAAGRRPVSAPVIAAAVRTVLDDEPGVFAPVAEHPATEGALVAAHRELAAVPDDALALVAACSPRANDVVRIHRAVRAHLVGDWYGEHDLLVAATEAWLGSTTVESGPVIVHLLQDIPPAGADLLRLLRPVHVNVGITGDDDADGPVLASHRRAGIEVRAQEIEPRCATSIVSTSDPDDEVRAAVRLVTRWMHEGINLGQIALVYGTPHPYARLVHEQLAAAGIPWNGAPVRTVGDLLFGRTLRALLALPDRGYRRPDVLAVLTAAPLLDGERRVPGRAWERLSREAGVVGGDDWDERLANLSSEQRRDAEAIDAEREDDWRADRKRRDAETADALALFVRRLRADLDAGAAAGSWGALVEWAKGLVDTYLGDERRRVRWPHEERLAAERVEAALDRLAGLDALGGSAPTVEVFRRALEGELDQAGRRVGRLGDGVLVGPVAIASGLVLDRVVVLGMAEGVFPPRRLEDSLLPDAERASAGGALQLRAQRVHDDRRHLLAAMASADEAVLCQPRGDLRRSRERPASRWLVADAARLSGVPGLRSGDLAQHAGAAWLDHVPSFEGGLVRLPSPASEQELRLAAIARRLHDHPAVTADGPLVAALEVVQARRSHHFTRFDGNLATVASELGRPPRASATRLQTWAACPHRYLLQYVLGVQPIEEPERLLMISPLDKGSLIHEILDEFVGTAISSGHPLDRWTPADQARLTLVAEAHFARYEADGRTGRRLFWRRDRAHILADLDRFLEQDSERLAQGHRPLGTEHPFADVPVTLPSGHVLLVGGKVDRIDRRPDGSLAVLDYKTGRDNYQGLSEQNPHGGGRWLQLYLYAVATEAAFSTDLPVWSAYWFNTSKGGFKQRGYVVSPEVAAEVSAAIDTIVEGIAAGLFPAHPAVPSSWVGHVDCWYCTPDGLSAADRRREWERKRLDPVLADYVGLADPEALDADV